MADVGDRIKFRRKELGLTQIQLAERLGLTSKAAISTVENNKEDMTLDRIERYANALNTTPQYLMGWSEDREQKLVTPIIFLDEKPPTEHELRMLEAYRKFENKEAIDSLLGVKGGDRE